MEGLEEDREQRKQKAIDNRANVIVSMLCCCTSMLSCHGPLLYVA